MPVTETHVGRIILGAGALVVIWGAVRGWHDERVFARMRATACTVLVKEVESTLLVDQGPRGGRGDITLKRARLRYRDEARLVFAHTLDGRKYTFREDIIGDRVADYEERQTYPCRYDPRDPGRATIATAFNREEVDDLLLGGGALIALGLSIPKIWRDTVDFAKKRGR